MLLTPDTNMGIFQPLGNVTKITRKNDRSSCVHVDSGESEGVGLAHQVLAHAAQSALRTVGPHSAAAALLLHGV